MEYEMIKGLHMTAVAVWVIEMLVVGGLLATGPAYSTVITLRRWDRRIGTPAMILVWLLGITLAVQGGWFVASWLNVKLLFVLALSALHGRQTGTLRRMAADPNKRPPAFAKLSPLLTALFVAIAGYLAVTKPF